MKTKQNRIDRKIKIYLKTFFFEMTIFNDLQYQDFGIEVVENGHHLTEDRDRKLFNL